MKIVINIKSCNEQSVQDDYVECSVCGEYHPPESYMKEGETQQTRTNCSSCYELPQVTWTNLKEFVSKQKSSEKYKNAVMGINLKKNYLQYSISVEEMIESLQALPTGSRLVMTQYGYYAEGKFASIYKPELEIEFDDCKYYSIGHSHQNY